MNLIKDVTAIHVVTFLVGFVTGGYILANEVVFFSNNIVVYAFFHTVPAFTKANSILSSFSTGIGILTVMVFIQGILIGTFLSEPLSAGYISADIF